MEEESNIINKFFQYREEKFIDEIDKDMNLLSDRVKDINIKEINRLVNSISSDNELKQKIKNSIDSLVADYNITMAYYNKKYYKQGFIDASQLIKFNKNLK